MVENCNKSFSELVEFRAIEEKRKFGEAQNAIQLLIASSLALVPGLSGAASLVDDISRDAASSLWGLTSTGLNTGIDVAASGVSAANAASAATGFATEVAITSALKRIVIARMGTAAATAVLPFLPEIAIAAAAFIVATVVAVLTKIVVQATIDYLNQPDQIFEITTADATDGTITINGVTSPIADGIRDGVDVRHLVATPNAVGPNSTIKVDLYGLSDGALYQLNLDCADGLKLSNVSDTLDVSKVDLTNLQSWRFLDDQFIIDMAGGIDTVRYAATPIQTRGGIQGTNGIFYYDGATHAAGGGFDRWRYAA